MAVSRPPISAPLRLVEAEGDGAPDGVPHRVEGRARLGRTTKRLAPTLRPGDIAVIDHPDLDRLSAEDLVESGVECVLNAAPSSTARFPNPGPLVLAEAGVLLVDAPDLHLFARVAEGDRLVVTAAGSIEWAGGALGHGEVQDVVRAERHLERGRRRLSEATDAFTANTMAHLRSEGDLLTRPVGLPRLRTSFRARPAVVAVRGTRARDELARLTAFIRGERPALVAVDGGADALLDAGLAPDVIVGDFDSASDAALRSGAELVVHAHPDGRAPGRERVERLGLAFHLVTTPGTSEDAGMLLAADLGAELLVAVGSSWDVVDFLDRGRAGVSSTFLTRLRTGGMLVSAPVAARLYSG